MAQGFPSGLIIKDILSGEVEVVNGIRETWKATSHERTVSFSARAFQQAIVEAMAEKKSGKIQSYTVIDCGKNRRIFQNYLKSDDLQSEETGKYCLENTAIWTQEELSYARRVLSGQKRDLIMVGKREKDGQYDFVRFYADVYPDCMDYTVEPNIQSIL